MSELVVSNGHTNRKLSFYNYNLSILSFIVEI